MPRAKKAALARYRQKRQASRTPEPFVGGGGGIGLRRFVVHLHDARRLHWDLRLEIGGTLASWAIPRGPSPDPDEKRMAAHVEDHPMAYGDFEGVIPDGNYGAGPSIVWDRGRFEPHDDPEEGVPAGKLLFTLHGYKLRGTWTLVKTGGKKAAATSKDWLLIKKPDGWARHGAEAAYPEPSVLSGLTVDERRDVSARLARLEASLARHESAPRRALTASQVEPMLAETAPAPFSGDDWLFELKYDGFRLLAGREGAAVKLRYRSGLDATHLFPEVALALSTWPYGDLVLDGEVVVCDEGGRPRFQLLQQRVQLSNKSEIERAALRTPATFFVFDCLAAGGRDLRGLPLVARKQVLRTLVGDVGPVRFTDHVEGRGHDFFTAASNLGLEGVVGKRKDSPYKPGRHRAWQKVRALKTGDFVVVGYTRPSGGRTGLGALILGAYRGGELVYAGRVGTGFSERQLDALAKDLAGDAQPRPPCQAVQLSSKADVWVEPRLVCEVRYTEWTQEGSLRQPVFLRLRDDKPMAECVLEAAPEVLAEHEEPPPPPEPEGEARVVPYTNLDKVFWPEQGYTKGDLIAYYRAAAPWLLPYLDERPVVLTRFPDGIDGKSFFQKDAPKFAPPWVRTERMWSEQATRDIDYFVCDDEESLLYLVNLGTIPLHVWSSRVATLERPDWSILDLDPKGAPFADVLALALAIRRLCEELELPSYPKTSGQSGLHVLIPLAQACTYEQSRGLAEVLAHEIVRRHPDIATVARTVSARKGKVYVDFGQNGHGRLLVSPFSARPVPGGPVSMTLEWKEVGPKLDPGAFTIKSAPRRLEKRGDPMKGVLTERSDLVRALARLAEMVPG